MKTRGEKTPRPRPNLRGTPEYPRGTFWGTLLCTPGPAGCPRVYEGTAGYPGLPRGTPVDPFVFLSVLTNVYLCAFLANFIFFFPRTARVQLPAHRLSSTTSIRRMVRREMGKNSQINPVHLPGRNPQYLYIYTIYL